MLDVDFQGTMTFGTRWVRLLGACTRDEAEVMFNDYVSKGGISDFQGLQVGRCLCLVGNFIDTANKYQEGETETWVGEMVQKRGGRDGLVISTKYSLPLPLGNVNFCGNHRKNMFFALENSLKRLRTDYIDLYYGISHLKG